MKKVLALTLLSLSFASSYAFAGQGTAGTVLGSHAVTGPAVSIYGGNTQQNATDAKSPLIKLSSKVSAIVNYDTTNQGTGQSSSYAIGTKHVDGSKVFGTANDSTTIYFKQNASGTILDPAVFGTLLNNSNFITTGWTAY
ncbi:hypothetical protein [Geomonas agri]|uniref:hypothetical protein n=1 Tax=Geomonas agri TaxID=2873702 RepID=UPI001CD24006|nr:hypothetical protein [Geomonas agri]